MGDFGGPSGFDPDLGIGNLGENPIEDDEFEQPQDSESGDIGSDHQYGLSQMMKMVCRAKLCANDAVYKAKPMPVMDITQNGRISLQMWERPDFPQTHRRLRM